MNDDELLAEYSHRHGSTLQALAARVAEHLAGSVYGMPRIDRVSARAKSPDRFMGKAMKTRDDGQRKYADPLDQIQDQIGARIIVFYLDDVETVSAEIRRYYNHIESHAVIPDSAKEFGYVGQHFILSLPEDVFEDEANRGRMPQFFELQIKTLFQHAWSEAEHDVGYKPDEKLTLLQRRNIALSAAQAWGADQIFFNLRAELAARPH